MKRESVALTKNQLSELRHTPRDQRVNVKGTIVSVENPVELTKKTGSKLTKRDCCLADHSMRIRLEIWGEEIRMVDVGCSYHFVNVRIKEGVWWWSFLVNSRFGNYKGCGSIYTFPRLLCFTMDADNDPPPATVGPCSLDTIQNDLLGDYKRLIVELGSALDDVEPKEKIRYLHKDKLGTGGESMTALAMLERLEGKGVFSARVIGPLEGLLRDCHRCDLIDTHLEPYRQKHSHQLNQAGERRRVCFVNKYRCTVAMVNSTLSAPMHV